MAKEEAYNEFYGVELTVKHTTTECLKQKRKRQNFKIDPIQDTALAPETEDNFKTIAFLKTTNRRK